MANIFQVYSRGLIINSKHEVLLIKKRNDQKYAAGKWIYPGGTVEWGEESFETLKRELKEEVNAQTDHFELIGTRVIITGDIHWQGIYYKATVSNIDQLINCEPHKHEMIAWFDRNHLPEDMDEIDRFHLSCALK